MHQRITHQVKGHLFSDWSDLSYNFFEEIYIYQFLIANNLRAETALQITHVTDLDMDLFKHCAKILRYQLEWNSTFDRGGLLHG